MEKGIYKTASGQTKNVVDFDDLNEMVYVHLEGSQYKWYPKSEYSTWTREDEPNEDTGEIVLDYISQDEIIPDISNQITEEPKPKRKSTPKKKKNL